MTTGAALRSIIEGIAQHIDEDVAAGLVVMAAGTVAARHSIPREDIVEYAVDYALQAAI